MTTVPFSIRLSEKYLAILDVFAKKSNKSTPDIIRDLIEDSTKHEFRTSAFDAQRNPAALLKKMRPAFDKEVIEPFTGPEYSALMTIWHYGYLKCPGEHVNKRYLLAIMEITKELLELFDRIGNPGVDIRHIRSKLELTEDESTIEGVSRLIKELLEPDEVPTVGTGDFYTRPIQMMTDSIEHIAIEKLHKVFTRHMETLVPFTVFCTNSMIEKNIIRRDMEALLPDAEPLKINGLSILLFAPSLTVCVSGNHHAYIFNTESVLGLEMGISSGVFSNMLADKPRKKYGGLDHLTRRAFTVTKLGQYHINEKGSYRLVLEPDEFAALVEYLQKHFAQPGWQWVLKRYRDLLGDY